jgi:hypothetical protein
MSILHQEGLQQCWIHYCNHLQGFSAMSLEDEMYDDLHIVSILNVYVK